jgi:hypothetical protein
VAELQALAPPSFGEMLVTVSGYWAPNDGGGGLFQWKPGDTTATDYGTIFPSKHAGAPAGRWRRVRVDVNTRSLLWFGAHCDGAAPDDIPLERALAASLGGGTILVPNGRACMLTAQHDLGNVNGTGQPALGITIRGDAFFGPVSTFGASLQTGDAVLVFDPPGVADCSFRAGGAMLTASATDTRSAGDLTFEDLTLRAGPSLGSCLLNVSGSTTSDATGVTVRRVQFLGNRPPSGLATATSGVYMANARSVTVDGCLFEGFTYDIDTSSDPQLHANNLVVTNSRFYSQGYCTSDQTAWAYVDPNPMINLQIGTLNGLEVSGNAFEQGPNGIHTVDVQGGNVEGNWFRGECGGSPAAGVWMNLEACDGCAVNGNYVNLGYTGVHGARYSGVILGNHFDSTFGTGVHVHAGAATVQGNSFEAPSNVGGIDIQLDSGNHVVGPNNHDQPTVQYYLDLGAASTGSLVTTSLLSSKTNDASAGGWTKIVDGQASLPKIVTLGPPVAAPATPPSGMYYVYVDSADGKLKAKGSNGTITVLASP